MSLELALLAAPLTWLLLAVMERRLPQGILAAQMREQAPGTPPVRQIGGLALIPVYLASLVAFAFTDHDAVALVAPAGASIALLWLVGMADDHRHLPAGLRLAAHLAAAIAVVWPLPGSMSMLDGAAPIWLERALIVAGLVYAVNVTNFMDGMDLMSVIGIGIPLAACGLLLAQVPGQQALAFASLAMAAALAGFAAFNRPPARLYLGDNGALPLGLAAGLAGLSLGLATNPVAAILPFGYYLADSASTLALRALRGDNLFRAHSGHAYQLARKAGRPVRWVIVRVAIASLALAALARFAAANEGASALVLAALAGMAVSATTVVHFRRQAA